MKNILYKNVEIIFGMLKITFSMLQVIFSVENNIYLVKITFNEQKQFLKCENSID